ncbi:MAG: hypothetical protein JO022_18775 [Acidobacteriaceae bacterium]|nr:hypothetical protein [Acidobacteriaceae bacterium]
MPENWIPETRNRIAHRRAKKPDTKAGQIWALWPEIKAALDDGQSFKSICHWLQEDAGIAVSLPSLRSYVSRSRRREAASRKAEAENAFIRAATSGEPGALAVGKRASSRSECDAVPVPAALPETPGQSDPLAGAMRALKKSRRFDIREVHGDGDPSGKNLI